MTDEEFIRSSVAMQLGGFTGPIAQSESALVVALMGSSGGAIAQLPAREDVVRLEEAVLQRVEPRSLKKPGKTEAVLSQIRSAKADFGFIVDMQDRRVRSVAVQGNPVWPVFCFNRVTTDAQRILWPLPIYHDLHSDHFLSAVRPEAVSWSEKIPRVVWRGITGGRVMGGNPADEGVRLKGLLRRYYKGKLLEQELALKVSSLPRFNALNYVKDDPRFDFGFVDGDGYIISETPLHAFLERPRMSRLEMQRHKYIAVLRGLDVGSSFYWVMNSGSVGFAMETPFETFGSRHFRPWEHYVPFREDCSDLVERFEWAEAHPLECKEMTRRAAEICTFLARADLREEILHGVVDHVAALPRI